MVSSGILEYVSPGEFRNNYTIGYGIEVNPERHTLYFTKKRAGIDSQTCIMG